MAHELDVLWPHPVVWHIGEDDRVSNRPDVLLVIERHRAAVLGLHGHDTGLQTVPLQRPLRLRIFQALGVVAADGRLEAPLRPILQLGVLPDL